jgi:hypothetical protein
VLSQVLQSATDVLSLAQDQLSDSVVASVASIVDSVCGGPGPLNTSTTTSSSLTRAASVAAQTGALLGLVSRINVANAESVAVSDHLQRRRRMLAQERLATSQAAVAVNDKVSVVNGSRDNSSTTREVDASMDAGSGRRVSVLGSDSAWVRRTVDSIGRMVVSTQLTDAPSTKYSSSSVDDGTRISVRCWVILHC